MSDNKTRLWQKLFFGIVKWMFNVFLWTLHMSQNNLISQEHFWHFYTITISLCHCNPLTLIYYFKVFFQCFLMLTPFHHIENNRQKAVCWCITLEVTFTLSHIACVNFLQPSVPPVTLISSGARRTGILATEADTPSLFVQWERACLRALVYVAYAKCEWLCARAYVCRRTAAETWCRNAKRHLVCNCSGFIGIW